MLDRAHQVFDALMAFEAADIADNRPIRLDRPRIGGRSEVVGIDAQMRHDFDHRLVDAEDVLVHARRPVARGNEFGRASYTYPCGERLDPTEDRKSAIGVLLCAADDHAAPGKETAAKQGLPEHDRPRVVIDADDVRGPPPETEIGREEHILGSEQPDGPEGIEQFDMTLAIADIEPGEHEAIGRGR